MKLIKHEPYILPAFVDGNLQAMGTDREPGLHLSHIVRRMRAEAGENNEGIPGEQEWMRAQIGFLWERAIEYAWKEYNGVIRPVQRWVRLVEDGVHMTPDGVTDDAIEEYKMTWKSRRRWDEDVNEFWYWHVQTMGYARALGLTKVRYIVFWAGGSYFKGPQAHIGPWETVMEWEQEELEENWRNVMRYKAVMEKEAADAEAERG